ARGARRRRAAARRGGGLGGQALGFRWAPSATLLAPGTELPFVVTTLRDAAKHLGDALTVAIDPSGNFLGISLTDANGTAAAKTVNFVAQRYVLAASGLKRSKLTELARLLDRQLTTADGTVQCGEAEHEQF